MGNLAKMRIRIGELLGWFLHRVFAVLATLYLLVPPGYCLCHGFDEWLPSPTTNVGDPEDDHVPGCPARKTPYLHQAATPIPNPELTISADRVVEAPPLELGVNSAWPIDVTPLAETSEPPLYLTLRALRI